MSVDHSARVCVCLCVCVCGDALPPSTLKQPLIRLDTTGGETVEGFVFTSLTKLDQRLAWENKKRCLSKYVCWKRAFDLSSLFLHAQGTNTTQNSSQAANIQFTCPGGLKAL